MNALSDWLRAHRPRPVGVYGSDRICGAALGSYTAAIPGLNLPSTAPGVTFRNRTPIEQWTFAAARTP